jgi:hypothetical protein
MQQTRETTPRIVHKLRHKQLLMENETKLKLLRAGHLAQEMGFSMNCHKTPETETI